MTISELKFLRESEDKVEFKAAEHKFLFNGGSHRDLADRRKCYLGYIVALANDIMKEAYSRKQRNPSFKNLPTEQILSDLNLLHNGKLNYAALLLLGKKEIIDRLLPQAKVIWEFRYNEGVIPADFRIVEWGAIFINIDKIWELVNRQNGNIPIESGAYILAIPTFNEAVIREAILNAIAHRDYTIGSDIVIKQSPRKISIHNPV